MSLFDGIKQETIARVKNLAAVHIFIHENEKKLMVEPLYRSLEMIYFFDAPEIAGFGIDRIESIEDLAETLLDLYEDYCYCDENELTRDAKILREWLLQNLKKYIEA